MVPTARLKRPETDEKGDRSEFGSMGANEKDRRSDKQRSSRSRRDATVLHARRPPRDVRMSRVLSIPEGRIKSSNPFLLEPYRKRLKRCAGCMSEFLHDPPAFVVSKREWHTYFYAGRRCLPWRKMCYRYRTSRVIRRHPDFDIAKVVVNLEQQNHSDVSICMSIFTVCVCARARACVWNKRDVCAFEMRFYFFRILHTNACTNTSFRAVSLVKLHTLFRISIPLLRYRQ